MHTTYTPGFSYENTPNEDGVIMLPEFCERCHECSGIFKKEKLTFIENVPFCAGCCTCVVCGQTATAIDEGDLVCGAHSVEIPDLSACVVCAHGYHEAPATIEACGCCCHTSERMIL